MRGENHEAGIGKVEAPLGTVFEREAWDRAETGERFAILKLLFDFVLAALLEGKMCTYVMRMLRLGPGVLAGHRWIERLAVGANVMIGFHPVLDHHLPIEL